MYLFSWQSPVMDGKYKAIHCIELPFVFDNIERCANMTGGGRQAQNLADKVSEAWIQFYHHATDQEIFHHAQVYKHLTFPHFTFPHPSGM